MILTKRQLLLASAGIAVAAAALRASPAVASTSDVDKKIQEFSAGKTPQSGKVTLTAPEIAENGNTVPITVKVDSKMAGDDMVKSIMIVADENPSPGVATFNFTEMSGAAMAATRLRLAKTQNVIAIAKMADGSVYMDKKVVKVTIGGCGG